MLTRVPYVEPPRASELELRTIAALTHIGNPNDLRVQKAILLLDEQCFMDIDYRGMYRVISELFIQQKDFDLISFLTVLPSELYLIANQMTGEYCSTSHLEKDVEQLIAYRTLRKQVKILTDAINYGLASLTPEESISCIGEHLRRFSDSSNSTGNSYIRGYELIADELLSETGADDSQFEVDIPGLPALPNRALITIAGRSGHGKTFFALYMMDKIIDAKPGRQTLYFNLEMHERVMMERHAILVGGRGDSRKERIINALPKLLDKNVSLISQPMITIEEIETQSRLAHMRQPIGVIVVDYLGLIRSKVKSERKDLEQGDIAKRLAALSIELDCTVIGLIQVNRDFKTRPIGDRCPKPEDSAESMGSVHSSSLWIGIDQPQNDTDDQQWKDKFIVQCRKNRGDSGLFTLELKFKGGMFSKWQRPFCSNYESKSDNRGNGF